MAGSRDSFVRKDSAKKSKGGTDREVLSGLIERVTFHNPENGFCVLKIKARGHRDNVTLVGHVANISPGEWVTTSGEWINDRIHGLQFRAQFLQVSAPTSLEGIEKYLGSGMIRGIGPVYAKRMVDFFGKDVFDIIEESPHRLHEIEGIGPMRADRIIAAWVDQKLIREVMVFLHQNGVGTARAVRIYKTYGADAVQVMSEDPYRLARDIRGIGFRTADQIAEKLGIGKTEMIRVCAGILFALAEAMGDGHCGLPQTELQELTIKLLEVPEELINEALTIELHRQTITALNVSDTPCIFLTGLYHAEQIIAEYLRWINTSSLPWPWIDVSKALPWAEAHTGFSLAKSQSQAVSLALNSKVTVITGGPGVGKTTIVNTILRILLVKKVKVLLCAPTGRAAKRMSEAVGIEAKTIHRLLEFDPRSFGFKRNEDNPLECDLLVIDESSMVDVLLMRDLLKAVPAHSGLLIVGDIDQLPSVGPGQVLADIISSGFIPVVHLTEVFRQAAQSQIIANAHQINEGRMPHLNNSDDSSDFYFISVKDVEQAVDRILTLVRDRIPKRFGFDPIQDIQVLCPMNGGGAGTRSLNIRLQEVLNPAGSQKIERFGWTFVPGDKVMQIENDYDKDIYNGDIGTVEDVDMFEFKLIVRYDERRIVYGFGELDTLVPAYATTIHKSQGSEYPAVVIPILMQHYTMLQRNLFYTGITRGRKLVVVVGQLKAVSIAVKNVSSKRRWSKLNELLTDTMRTNL